MYLVGDFAKGYLVTLRNLCKYLNENVRRASDGIEKNLQYIKREMFKSVYVYFFSEW